MVQVDERPKIHCRNLVDARHLRGCNAADPLIAHLVFNIFTSSGPGFCLWKSLDDHFTRTECIHLLASGPGISYLRALSLVLNSLRSARRLLSASSRTVTNQYKEKKFVNQLHRPEILKIGDMGLMDSEKTGKVSKVKPRPSSR